MTNRRLATQQHSINTLQRRTTRVQHRIRRRYPTQSVFDEIFRHHHPIVTGSRGVYVNFAGGGGV